MKPDKVAIDDGTMSTTLSITDFQSLPLDQRVELLFRGKVTFFAGDVKLPTEEALKVLREGAANAPD